MNEKSLLMNILYFEYLIIYYFHTVNCGLISFVVFLFQWCIKFGQVKFYLWPVNLQMHWPYNQCKNQNTSTRPDTTYVVLNMGLVQVTNK